MLVTPLLEIARTSDLSFLNLFSNHHGGTDLSSRHWRRGDLLKSVRLAWATQSGIISMSSYRHKPSMQTSPVTAGREATWHTHVIPGCSDVATVAEEAEEGHDQLLVV